MTTSARSVDDLSQAEQLACLPLELRSEFWKQTPANEARALPWLWSFWARPKQLPPEGDWLTWMLRAGRGFGKTRTGGGWIHQRAMEQPGRWIALIGKTPADVRDYQVEGPGGILRNVPPWECPNYEPSKRRLTWPNESWATVFSSEEPDQLRGFSGDTAWFDELAKYKNPRECWDNLQFGMRELSNDRPRVAITTTPRPLPMLEEIEAEPTTVVVTGSSYENRSNLSPIWFDQTINKYEGTRLGRQEIHAEILEDAEGRVYDTFINREFPEGNLDSSIRDTGAEVLIGQDFNINPMASVVAIRAGDECLVMDAIQVGVSNTEQVAEEYKRRFAGRKVIICPDPTGNQRKSSAPVGQTDFTIFQRAGFEIRAPKQSPLVVDRVNNTNALFSRKKIRIHPQAKPLIKALLSLTYKQGTSIRDKGSGWDHVCDALDYLTWSEFNILEEVVAPAHSFSWRL